jgi:tetratricopeptide (TPR) repeat protein
VAHSNFGKALDAKGETREAEEQLRQAIAIEPCDFQAQNGLGVIERRRGNIPVAIEHFFAALNAKPAFALAHSNLAVAYNDQGRAAEAEQECLLALQIDPDLADAEDNLGNALAAQNRWTEAIPHYRRAVELEPTQANSHFNLGMALFAVRSFEEGINEIKSAIRLSPDDVASHFELAKRYDLLGRLHEAQDEWLDVLSRHPGHPGAVKGMGMTLLKENRGANALPYLQAVLAINPHDLEARKYKAFAHLLVKQRNEAIAEFREILRQDPQDPIALNSLAWIDATSADATLRNAKEAVAFAEKAAASAKGDSPQTLDTLAAAYAEAGRFKEAVETARKAKKAAEKSPDKGFVQGIDARLKLYEAGKPYRE